MYIFFFKQKTAYEMRISDWSSDVCSSDLVPAQGKLWEYLGDLKGSRHAQLDTLVRNHHRDVLTIKHDATGRGFEKPADQIEESGFARAIRADQPPKPAPLYRHVNILDRHTPSKMLRTLLYIQQATDNP